MIGRRGSVLPWLLGLSLISLVMVNHKVKLTPAQRLSTVRMTIVRTAQDVEAAYQARMLSPEEYTASKDRVMKAVDTYNIVEANFRKTGAFSNSDRAKILALVNSALEIVQKSNLRVTAEANRGIR